MSEFDDELIATGPEFLTVFGEAVKYLPHPPPPPPDNERDIVMIIQRGSPDDLDGAPHGHAPLLTGWCLNNNVTGIAMSEIDTGGDQVKVAVRTGKTAQDLRITRVLQEDAGMLKLELR